MNLPLQDQRHLLAAEGWLELGDVDAAHQELEQIAFGHRTHHAVLQMRVRLYAQARKWDHVEAIAATLARLAPDHPFGVLMLGTALRNLKRHQDAVAVLREPASRFTTEWRFAYELACSLCGCGELKGALTWLEVAFDRAGKQDVRTLALDEPDLEPLWTEIAQV
jgi:predicted Zn-dependent protease